MRLRLTHIVLFFCLFKALPLHAQSPDMDSATPIKWKPEGVLISLKDELKHPMFSWPLSTLQYKIDFGAGVTQSDLGLVEETANKSIPFQLVNAEIKNGKVQKATLVFVSDLPTGANNVFRLTTTKKGVDETAFATVKVEKTADVYAISNGLIKLEIPTSQSKIGAPIKRYGNATTWLGYGELPASLSATKMTVTELAAGPVQAAYLLTYEFAGNKKYTIKVKLNAAVEFAEIEEEMSGFEVKDNAVWKMVWNGISLDHRYACTRGEQIDKKQRGYTNYAWEPMEGLPSNPAADKHPLLDVDQQNDKDGKLPFRIAPYDNWMTWWRFTCAAFWSEKENTTVGLFIKDMEKWNDGLYSLWGSKQNINIYFHWNNKTLDYTFPLVNGTRSAALAAYTHQKDVDLVDKNNTPLTYIEQLRHWQGWITLDKVKEWTLNYDGVETGYPKYFKQENATAQTTVAALENSLSNNLKTIATGTERMNGPNPVSSRVYHEFITPAFDLNAAQMTKDQYQKLRAWYLFVAYLYMDETLMPIRTMFAGHPNFLSDIKVVPGMAAFLFPKHPQASKMADHYEKAMHLNFNYHIRPDVAAWDAKGGRWTENLATYTWAALTPNIRTSYLLHHEFDNKNRLLQPGVSMYGNWLLNSLTSPVSFKNNRRVYPPQGAHSLAYDGPPNALRLLAQEVRYYDPLLSEKILWLTTSDDSPFESNKDRSKAWGEILKGDWENNKGTNPHLKSGKYTGYGFVLRNGFGTKDEMFVNLQQIDEGPNYRWGRAAMGGNGIIYYYAQGKRYSHNGSEDVGDGPFGDVERVCNFGVKKAGGYRSIGAYRSVGKNDLTEPLFDFGFAQFATVKGNAEIAQDYHARSVLQSAADYIVIFDEVKNEQTEGRFSWFVGTDDEFPTIHQILPGATGIDAGAKPSKSNYHKDPDPLPTKGKYYDGKGDFLTVVTHKAEIKVTKTAYGCLVEKANNTSDLIFRSVKNIEYAQDGIAFNGTAGIVQKISKENYSAALFAGTKLELPGIKISLQNDNNAAISLVTLVTGFSGKFQSRKAEQMTFTTVKKDLVFYLDGAAVINKSAQPLTVQITIPEGKHTWQLVSNGVTPVATEIVASEVKSQGVLLTWKPVAGATSYLAQLSKDGGNTWTDLQDKIIQNTASFGGLKNGDKAHFRIVAKGQGGSSEPSDEYPVYVTDKVPHAPEGLMLNLNGVQAKITWGKILGAGKYQLYRRQKNPISKAAFEKIYTGNLTNYLDEKPATGIIYEYVVTAINGNGESLYNTIIDTDPKSFLNWEPKGGEGFRRDTEDHENGFIEFNPFVEDKKPILAYPGNK